MTYAASKLGDHLLRKPSEAQITFPFPGNVHRSPRLGSKVLQSYKQYCESSQMVQFPVILSITIRHPHHRYWYCCSIAQNLTVTYLALSGVSPVLKQRQRPDNGREYDSE
jgi:hypothetical protein